MSNISKAIELKAQLDALRPLSADQEQRIWQKFRFDWNYHSNNIEGNSLTFGETKSLLLHNITAQGKPLKDHIEITGHNEAITALLDMTRGNVPLTESFFRNLHMLILRERYQVDAQTPDGRPTKKWIEVGQYKTAPNHVLTVTGEIFRFAEPFEVPGKMQRLVGEVNALAAPADSDVLIAAAKFHYDLVLIHPFDDGNGRMARLLMNLILIKYGFPPAIIRTEDKANYFSALRQADGGQFDVFAEYIAGCVCTSLQIMLAGARNECIDETNEQDQQLKMLARLLEERRQKIATTRSREVLSAFYGSGIKPLIRQLYVSSARFSKLYLESQFFAAGHHFFEKGVNAEEKLLAIESSIADSTNETQISGTFSYLRFKGLENFSYHWHVTFNFAIATFRFTTSFPYGTISRSYDEPLSSTEISEIADAFFADHLSAIEKTSGVSVRDLLAAN